MLGHLAILQNRGTFVFQIQGLCVGRWRGLPHEMQNAEEQVSYKPDYSQRSWVAQFTKFVIFKINLFQSLTELLMDTIFYILHIVYLRIIFHLTI